MKPYQHTREQRERRAKLSGAAVTLTVHALALGLCLVTGLRYLDPPPPERTSLLIEFDEAPEVDVKPVENRIGREPQADETDPEKEVELIQRSASPHVTTKPASPANQRYCPACPGRLHRGPPLCPSDLHIPASSR